tara:strand:- start:2323 stop:2697 length:375 start_codon:yes stop_codon:yes gene_type:complete
MENKMNSIMDFEAKVVELALINKNLKKELKKEKFNNEVLQQDLDWYKKEYPVDVEIGSKSDDYCDCGTINGTCDMCYDVDDPTVDEIDEIHNHINEEFDTNPDSDKWLNTLDKVANMINKKNGL